MAEAGQLASPGTYRASGVARTVSAQTPIDVEFSPFYLDASPQLRGVLGSPHAGDLTARAAELAAERERMRALEAATIALADPGDRENEKKFNQQGVETSVIRTDGRVRPTRDPVVLATICRQRYMTMVGARRDL